MDLNSVARYFDRVRCLDGYTGAFAFLAQLGLYDDNKRDSETAGRRVLSAASGVPIPTRRVVQVEGVRFIIGHSNIDSFLGSTIRVGYVAQEAPFLAQVRTLGQICETAAGFTAWAGHAWVKNAAFTEQSSVLVPQEHIHFSTSEPVVENHVVTLGPRSYIIRTTNFGTGGTLVCTAEEIPTPVTENCTINVGVIDPVTETSNGVDEWVRVVRLRWQSLFKYGSHLAQPFGPDDIQIAVAKSQVTPTPGSILVMSDGTWQVASAIGVNDAWVCRATRHDGP